MRTTFDALKAMDEERQRREEQRALCAEPTAGFASPEERIEFVRRRCELIGLSMPNLYDVVAIRSFEVRR